MNREKIIGALGFALLISALTFGHPLFAADTQTPPDQTGHRSVTGVISKVTPDMLSLKTNEGTTRNFSFKEARREGIGGLSVGDKVTLDLDEGNQIIDIDKATGAPPSGVSGEHRTVTGTVVNFDKSKKEVTLKLKDGKTQTFTMKDPAATKMKHVKSGTLVTMHLDEENSMVMDFDPQKK